MTDDTRQQIEREKLRSDLLTLRGRGGRVIDSIEVDEFLDWYDNPNETLWKKLLWRVIIPTTRQEEIGITLQKACCIMSKDYKTQVDHAGIDNKAAPMPNREVFLCAIAYATH